MIYTKYEGILKTKNPLGLPYRFRSLNYKTAPVERLFFLFNENIVFFHPTSLILFGFTIVAPTLVYFDDEFLSELFLMPIDFKTISELYGRATLF